MCRNTLRATVLCLAVWSVLTVAAPARQSKRSLPEIVADLKKGDADKLRAIAELEALGDRAAEAAPALVGVLASTNEDVRLGAALALGKIGTASVEPLARAAASPDADIRFYAIWGLAFVGPPARSAAPTVVKALSDASAQVRRKAAYALGRIDTEPKLVVAALVTALADPDADVRQAVEQALPKLGKAAVPALVTALHNDKPGQRRQAIHMLGAIGADAGAAVPELLPLLLAPDKGLAEPAAQALGGIGAPALPALTTAAANDQSAVRSLALDALERIGVPAAPRLSTSSAPNTPTSGAGPPRCLSPCRSTTRWSSSAWVTPRKIRITKYAVTR